MKKDKLYTVNKWNQPMFADKNLFWPGGEMNSYGWTPSQMEPTSSLAYKSLTVPTLPGYENYGPANLTVPQNPLQNYKGLSESTIKDVNAQIQQGMQQTKPKKGLSDGTKMAMGVAGSAVGDFLSNIISNGYSAGDGFNTVMSGIRNVNTGNPIVDAVKNVATTAVQAIGNRGWGTRENKGNINTLEQNTAQANMAGNALAGSTTSNDFFNNAGLMTTGTGFGTSDLVKGGWFAKGKARRKGQKYLDKEANALAMQNQGMVTGANNVDSYMDDAVMSNFAALGGPINTENNNSMGALEYGLMSDFLNTKQRQAENKNNMGNLFAGMPGSMFALGGDIQTNGADFTTGMTHVNAGGSHEENPNEGIQMGVDPQGTPNLVEENETVYNDYVYSNRIFADGGTLKKFHLPKKAKLTYADITKKLEKEIKERPNDPISQAAFKAQMEDLANEQERQKQEMEAERAREAFEALSPEEQVEVMQYAQQQEQAQQEAAMQEQAMAEQQAVAQQQPSPEEMAMMQQQMQGQPMMAYGGKVNRFDLGGGLKWIQKNHPEIVGNTAAKLGKILDSIMANNRANYMTQELLSGQLVENYGKLWASIMGSNNTIEGARKNVKSLIKLGLNDAEAYNLINQNITGKKYKDIQRQLYDDYQGKKPTYNKQSQSASTTSKSTQVSTTVPSRASVFSSVSNAVDRAYADAQANAQAKAQTAAATTTSTTTNPDPFGVEARTRKFQDLRNSSKATASESSTVEEVPVAEATPRRRTAAPSNTNVQTDRGSERNVGDWKNPDENHWDLYTKPGFEAYIDNAIARYNMAGTDEARRAIQDEVMNSVNGLQQSYNDVIAPIMGASKYSYSPEVETHQTKFENLGGNRGFWPTQEDGSIVNAIGNAINLPLGYSTGDNPSGRGIDGYNGRQTEQRHFGSTADGDATYFAPLVDKIRSGLNLNYSPNASWSYGKDGQYQLYGLSRIEAPAAENSASPAGPLNAPAAPAENASTNTSVPGRYGNMPWAPENTKVTEGSAPAAATTATTPTNTPAAADEYDVAPVLKKEWPRYAGLFGPAVGLGMQALGIGRPNTKALDGVLEAYDRTGAAMADYKPIGDYLRYNPMDIWAEQNRLNANARATDRALANNSAPVGTRAAGLLANEYNNQIGSGELYRKALEYNDALRERTAAFNRGTNQFNAEAYNRTALQNAEIRNRDRQLRAQLGMQAAAQKADMDAGWYNGIYGNVAGLFKGISDLGRENAQHNMIAKMAADGIFGNISDKQFTGQGFLKRVPKYTASEGGKIGKKKGKRGLTI